MTSPYHILSGNRFPTQDGKPVLVDEFKFRGCCCNTPCACGTLYEWDCDADNWVLVLQGKYCEGEDFNYLPSGPYDQWNYFYFKRTFPNREATVIQASYGSWIGQDEECTWPSLPSAPNEAWRQFKCDGSVPTPEPEADGECQPMALYFYDCVDEEWDLIRVDIVRVRVPEGTEIPDPEDFRLVRVFGKVFDCSEDEPADPPPPKRVTKEQLDCAPSTCPCTQVDPAEWPCGGLLETYIVSSWILYRGAGGGFAFGERQVRLKTPIILTDRTNDLCGWANGGRADMEESDDFGATWADVSPSSDYFLSIGLDSVDGWYVACQTPSVDFYNVYKVQGQTPVGSYWENVEKNNSATADAVEATVS